MRKLLTLAVIFALFMACKTPAGTSMITGVNYDGSHTVLTLLPYGNIAIPGKWTESGYDPVSKQHYFVNSDSTTISATKNPQQRYAFAKERQLTDKAFTQAFVQWDTAYWNAKGVTAKVLSDQSDNGFMLWQAQDSNKRYVNTIFLYGARNGYAYNFSGNSSTWTQEKIQDFLIQLFKEN